MSNLFSFFHLAGLVAFAIVALRTGRHVSKSNWVWAAPAPLVLATLSWLGFAGLVEGDVTTSVGLASSILVCAAGLTSLKRNEVWAWYDTHDEKAKRRFRVGLVLSILTLSMLTVEVPYNSLVPLEGPLYFWLEMILCGLFLLGLYFLAQRHAGLCCLGIAFFFVTGIGQYFIKRFKNAAILPTDLLALNTAAAVTKEYVFTLGEQTLRGITIAMLAICLLSLVRPPAGRPRAAANLAGAAGSFAALAFLVLVPSYMGLLGVQMRYWFSIDCYEMQGFYPTFVAVMQDMPIRRPEGYTDDEARRLTESYAEEYRSAPDEGRTAAAAQFSQLKPSVIVVMNESFSDLSTYDGLHAGYEGPQFFRTAFGDALARGTLNVTVHGAGTCNTEFEFLTGSSLGFIGVGKYPYSVYDFSNVDALAAQFKDWGYHTRAIHPNFASNWNRDEVYPLMGFDEFLAIDDFGGTPDPLVDRVTPNEPHCEVFHSGVSDKETYDRILALLAADDSPQLFFDVTMANHGSYDQNNIPLEYQQHYEPADYVGEDAPGRLNEYLACMQKSDDDLKEFVGSLRQLERPVVLVFFGDHQPSISASFNDCWYPNEPESVHARRAFCTDYVIWANYDVAGREQTGMVDETSVDLLAAQALDLIGAPVSEFQEAQLSIRRSIPSLSASDYQGKDRTWYAPDEDGPYAQTYRDLSLIEYLNFATRV